MREEGDEINFKKWLSKTAITAITLLLVILLVDRYINIGLFTQSLVAISISIFLGFAHEGLHYAEAKKLGYEPTWFRTKFRMGFTINSHSKRSNWIQDKKKIALMPYYFLIPISTVLIAVGLILDSPGVAVAGIATLLMHGYSIRKEGIDI